MTAPLTEPKRDAIKKDLERTRGVPGVALVEIRRLDRADIAIGRLHPWDPAWVSQYPVFKDPSRGIRPGTSLCRMGFPFHEVVPGFDEQADAFRIVTDPFPLFPLEGIFTREVILSDTHKRPFPLMMIETSSPGLKGQSGGPVFDKRGTVWGIQSQTKHFELDFAPAPKSRRNAPEHQFLSAGWAVHPATLCGAFEELGIPYQKSDY